MSKFIKSLSIKEYRGFFEEQKIKFAIPSGTVGSGLTIIVGQNNSGKSTIIDSLRRFHKNTQFERTDRHPGADVEIKMENVDGGIKTLRTNGSSLTQIDFENLEPIRERFYLISSRRYWDSYFGTNSIDRNSYKHSLFDLQRDGKDGSFGQKMIEIERESSLKKRFNELMVSLFPQFSDWYIELDRGSNYITYKTKTGATHISEFFGDGIISLFKIAAGLVELRDDEILVVDEPELSLHPQAQKKLANVIRSFTDNHQIILITHSPYFVNWDDLRGGAVINKLTKYQDKQCIVHNLDHEAKYYEKLFKFSGEWRKPQQLDVVAKELFFSDSILLFEGQEDVGLLRKFLNERQIEIQFDIFGYGVGGAGNIIHLLEMCEDLGIKASAVYDGDQKDLAKVAFDRFPQYLISTLPEDDIRDKTAADSSAIVKAGIFDQEGNIKGKYEEYFSSLIEKINKYFEE